MCNTTNFIGIANSRINLDLEVHTAQQDMDNLALDLNTQKVHTFLAKHKIIRPTIQEDDQVKVKKVRVKVTETTKTNEEEERSQEEKRTELERGPLKIVINTHKGKMPHIMESSLIIDEVNDEVINEAITKGGGTNSNDNS